jgi:hypothetical protein
MSTDPVLKELVELAESMSSQGDTWPLFLKELENCGYDSDKPFGQGEPASLARLISIDLGPRKDGKVNITRLFDQWDHDYKRDLERRVKQRYLDSTVEVFYIDRSGKLKKPERIPKEDSDKPWKPGCHIENENARVEGRGWDSDNGATFVLRTTPIGTEIPTGTIVGKRKIGGKIQYLVKPRSSSAEKKYQAKLELESLRQRVRDWEMYSPEDLAKFYTRIKELEKYITLRK